MLHKALSSVDERAYVIYSIVSPCVVLFYLFFDLKDKKACYV